MEMSELYAHYSKNIIVETFEESQKDQSELFFIMLELNNRIERELDGTIKVDINNTKPFFIYSSEFLKFREACLSNIITEYPFWSKYQVIEIVRKRLNPLIESTKIAGLKSSFCQNRHVDYDKVISSGKDCGFSISKNYISNTNVDKTLNQLKCAMIFTDLLVGEDIICDFARYDDIVDICKNITDHNFANSIFDISKATYLLINEQLKPILSGKLMENRINNGKCPHCGGSYKGIIKKKCINCNSLKEY